MVRLLAKDFKKAGDAFEWSADGKDGRLPSYLGAPEHGVLMTDRIAVLFAGTPKKVICFSLSGAILWRITTLPQMGDARLDPAGLTFDEAGDLFVGNWAGHAFKVDPKTGAVTYSGYGK